MDPTKKTKSRALWCVLSHCRQVDPLKECREAHLRAKSSSLTHFFLNRKRQAKSSAVVSRATIEVLCFAALALAADFLACKERKLETIMSEIGIILSCINDSFALTKCRQELGAEQQVTRNATFPDQAVLLPGRSRGITVYIAIQAAQFGLLHSVTLNDRTKAATHHSGFSPLRRCSGPFSAFNSTLRLQWTVLVT